MSHRRLRQDAEGEFFDECTEKKEASLLYGLSKALTISGTY